MRRFRQTAGERLLALAAALGTALGGQSAHAQTDPFALPTGVTAQSVAAQSGPGLSEIAIDGETRARLVDLSWANGVLTISAESAKAAGLPIPADASGQIPLSSIKIAKWSFDSLKQRLDIQLLRKSDGKNLIDMGITARLDGTSTPLTAFRIDYDMTATAAQGRTGAAAFLEASVVRGNFAALSSFQYNTDPQPGSRALTRLDSQVQVLLPKPGITATAGDFISAGGQNQRALRLGGVQIASDYSLRPDLVTVPLPAFTGQVSVPTGVELISGDQRYSLGDVQPGEFTVRNVPSNAGRGEVAVVIRDSLGREVIQNARFYMSRSLLAPRLREYAINAGVVRRRYGVRSSDYGPLAASIYYRRGVSSRFTVEGTSEWTPGLINMGARGDLALGGIALATVEARASSEHSTGKAGALVNLALESVGRTISARVSASFPSTGYRDVAAKLGDPLSPREFLGQISFNLKNMTQLQLSAGRQERHFDSRYPSLEPRVTFANAAFRTRISKKVDFYSSVGMRNGLTRSVSAWAGLSFQFGGGRSAQGSASSGTGMPVSVNAGYYRHATEQQRLGYAFEGSTGASTRISAAATYRSTFTRVEAQAERVAGRYGMRLNARGTLLMAGGSVFARNQTGGSYALVRTGKVAGVTVLRENRAAGVTKKGGLLLVENITPQVPLSFDIDPDKLPVNALARDTHRRVLVPRRAIGLVSLDVIRFAPRQVRITGPTGVNLPVGTILLAQPSGDQMMVGFDGLVDFNAEGGDTQLDQILDGGSHCVASIKPIAVAATDEIAVVACRIEIKAEFAARSPNNPNRPAVPGRGKGAGRR
ncbi:fimbria/pilus outer membrane usher protein [Novosphingobium sp.]|uniref:fimbria/pilus outer membrane usher protein n=1 Tax=Novosphingobium sp. TaxID=1874826 RepID=UPI0025F916CA|nr:fimbria/pilus outer membrane usher protein [Novosphingobium sp.]